MAVKARIHAFEVMQTGGPKMVSPDLLETPISPTATVISPILPSTTPGKSMPPSPSPSPPNLGRKTSLIDLKDWVVDDGPLPYVPRQKPPVARKPPPLAPKPAPRHVSDSVVNKPPPLLISLDSPPKTQTRAAPPLPPRKASYSSLNSISPTNTSNSNSRSPCPPVPPLPPAPARSDSLTVDHTYPPLSKLGMNMPSRHVPGSSISSFHSVSLSSDGDPSTPGTASSIANHVSTYPIDRDDDLDRASFRDLDAVSLDESFENLSVTSAVSPSASSLSHDWEVYAKREPPKLPQRPTKPPTSAPTSPRTSPHLAPKRDGPPPPPPRSRPPSSRNSLASTSAASTSDRSSILSTATSRTSVSTLSTTTPKPKSAMLTRPTPVPPAARKRYEAVFNGNVIASRQAECVRSPSPLRKPRQAAGWRGLSVDLITNPEEIGSKADATVRSEPIEEEVGDEDRLGGETVKAIWKLSRLERATLRVIWMECDPSGTGSLDRDGFIKGMWRIDEELRKAQMHKHIVPRIQVRQPKPTHPPKPILR